jgi:hypothetical protein
MLPLGRQVNHKQSLGRSVAQQIKLPHKSGLSFILRVRPYGSLWFPSPLGNKCSLKLARLRILTLNGHWLKTKNA